jgi:uncharacterized repeat protein (TIGR02543 family)
LSGIDYSGNNFIDTAFTEAEQEAIATTSVINDDNGSISGGDKTDDKVFLLSLSEVTNTAYGFADDYGTRDTERVALNTAYVKFIPGMNSDTNFWWLRSPGYNVYCAAVVLTNGSVYPGDAGVDIPTGAARPALKLDLGSVILRQESANEFSVILKSQVKPAITTADLPGGKVGTAYSQILEATTELEYSDPAWSIESGSLPAGLTLAQDGTISGTPTAAGTSAFTVRAQNAGGYDTKDLSIVVAEDGTPALPVVPDSKPSDTKAQKYKVKFNANGGKLSKAKSKAVTKGKKYGKLPKPTRKGYNFKGWYTKKNGGKRVTANTVVGLTKNTTLYARWAKKQLYGKVKQPPYGGLHIRQKPTLQSKALSWYKPGMTIRIYDKVDRPGASYDWYKVKYKGKTAYIYAPCVKLFQK